MDLRPEQQLKRNPKEYWRAARFAAAEKQRRLNERTQGPPPASIATASPASPRQSSPKPQAVAISAEQAAINKLMGLSDADFLKYHNAGEHR
jgi:hypothetical protein